MCWVSEVRKGHQGEKNSLKRDVLGQKLQCNAGGVRPY